MCRNSGPRALFGILACVVAVPLASAASGLPGVFRDLRASDDTYASLSTYDAEHFGATHNSIDAAALDLYRKQIRASDRYYLLVGRDATFRNANGSAALPFYVRYWLAPARQVRSASDATVVLAYAAQPHALPLRYSRVASLPTRTGYAVARVAG
jgi:hypothetical protein